VFRLNIIGNNLSWHNYTRICLPHYCFANTL